MNRPDVSVIMPFYNAARWIGAAVRSLNDADGLRMELIAVDDASTDASAEIVEKTSSLPVRFIRNDKNSGTATSLNRGLAAAGGEFIARMDADDVCLPGRFIRQIAHLRETGCDLCGAWIHEFGRGIPRKLTYPVGEDTVHTALLFQNPVCHPTILARRRVFARFQYNEQFRVAQDYDLLSRISSEFRIDNVPEVLLRYRRHRAQTTIAKRELVASMADRIRGDTLRRRGFPVTASELRLHNLIRSPHGIAAIDDLLGIESWLLKLCSASDSAATRLVISRQWVFACVRAGNLGPEMWKTYSRSSLHRMAATSRTTDVNLYLLSKLRLNYETGLFETLARLRICI
jgi:glycosyltransferase involved in cell wall biosynthesis